MAAEDYESEDEIEEIRQENPAVRAKAYMLFGLEYVALILLWVTNPLPVQQVAWPTFFGFIVFPGTVLYYITKFLLINGSAKIALGDTEFTTIHDTKRVGTVQEMYDRRSELVHGRMWIWRISGFSNFIIKGRNFAVFPALQSIIEDGVLFIKVHADFDRYMWWELPPWMRTKFVFHGRIVMPGFHKRKSKTWLAWDTMPFDRIAEAPHTDPNRLVKMLSFMLYGDERAFYRRGAIEGAQRGVPPPQVPGIGESESERPYVE